MEDIVKEADEVIQSLIQRRFNKRTQKEETYLELHTSQIRKFLRAVNAIRNEISVYKAQNFNANKLPEDIAAQIKFLKVRAAYQMGRDKKEQSVRKFMEKGHILEKIDAIGTSYKAFDEFAAYMEALVAYHKFYGGID